MEAKEPVAPYYTGAMMNAMRASIVNMVQHEHSAEKLEQIYTLCSPTGRTFAEQYAESKAICEEIYPPEMWPELARHDYFVQHMFDDKEPETEEDLDKLMQESEEEAPFAIPHEVVMQHIDNLLRT